MIETLLGKNNYMLIGIIIVMLVVKTRQKLEKDYEDLDNRIHIGAGTILEPSAVIYPDVNIGNNCIIATSAVIKPHTKIGDHSILGTLSNSEGKVKIGSWTTIQAQCYIAEGTQIGDNCFIGPLFMSVNTKKIGAKNSKFGYPNTSNMERTPAIIKNNVQIGSRVSIMPGIIVGDHAIIDAGSFITKPVSEGAHIRSKNIPASEI